MSRVTHEENVKVYFVPAVAAVAAPTLAEITAGTYLGFYITKDGVALNMSENMVDIANIEEKFDAKRIGTFGMDPSLTLFRDDTDEDDSYDLLVRGTEGYLLYSPFGTPVAGSNVVVAPVEIGITQIANSATNEAQKFTVNFAVTAEPDLRAVVAAS